MVVGVVMLTSVKAYEDEGKLSAAERALIAAVRAGKDCDLSDTRPDTATDANTIRADLLALLITGGSDSCGLLPFGVALVGAYITITLTLTQRRAVGVTGLFDCHFDSAPELRGAKFTVLGLDGSRLPALSAQGIEVAQSLFLRGARVTGTTFLNSAKIGGNLECDGAILTAQAGDALNAQSINVAQGLFLRNYEVTGWVRLSGAKIGGYLDCEGATFDGKSGDALTLQRASVGAALVWRNVTVTSGMVMLAAATVGDLWDDVASWPRAHGPSLPKPQPQLHLDGFAYTRLFDTTTRAKDRLPWLAAGSYWQGQFTPQPYTQLAKVLREMGHDREARIVLMERGKAAGAKLV